MRVTDSDRTGLYRWADPVGYRVWAQHVADRGLLLDAMAFRRDGIVPVWAKEARARGCLGRGGCPLVEAHRLRSVDVDAERRDAVSACSEAMDRLEVAGGETPKDRREAKDRLVARGAAPLAETGVLLEELAEAVRAAKVRRRAANRAKYQVAPCTCLCRRLEVWNMIADAAPAPTCPV